MSVILRHFNYQVNLRFIMSSLKRVCVYGAGTLGWQITLQCAFHGHGVNLYDISGIALEGAYHRIAEELDQWVVSGEATPAQRLGALAKINRVSDAGEAVRDVDMVIEAVPERLEVKRVVFKELDAITNKKTILATNSSSIRVSKIEDATTRPDRVINTHFYSLPWRSRIVELMGGTKTSDETIRLVERFMRDAGMLPLIVRKESTGFIHNRIWRAVKREALHLVDDGVASYEDVDRAWMSIYGTGIGPFGLMDRVGLDVVKDIEMVYYSESRAERDAPPRLLLDKIERGELGVKTGKGFYIYPNPAYLDDDWLKP
jgi:3-hydroxybutyryl-CoA dehydrogenase